jgi:hypothetical protein
MPKRVAALLAAVLGFTLTAARPGTAGDQERLPLAAPAQTPNEIMYIDDHSTVRFGGRDYEFEEAMPVLLQALSVTGAEPSQRVEAAWGIGLIGNHPIVATYLPELLRLARAEQTFEVRGRLLMALSRIDDPTLLGYFEELLQNENDPFMRLLAAQALARWNVLDGIRELVQLLGSDSPSGSRPLAGEAIIALQRLNEKNGWQIGVPITCGAWPRGMKPSESAELTTLRADLTVWLDANAQRFPQLPAALREQWRVYLRVPAEDHTAERQALKRRVRTLIERLPAEAPDKEVRAANSARVELLTRAWSLPVDNLSPGMLEVAGQEWYLKGVEAFSRAHSVGLGGTAQRVPLVVPRLALRSGGLADHAVTVRERESMNERLKPALDALMRACLPTPARQACHEAEKRFVELATSAFFWGRAVQLKSTEQWDALASRAVTDWISVRGSDTDSVRDAGPRLGEALFWATIDDPDARLLYRDAISGGGVEKKVK